MTYFDYKRVRLSRSEDVYSGGTRLGRVAVKADWRARFTLRQGGEDRYSATTMDGTDLPDLYRSRHDAAEALYEAAHGAPAHPDVIRPAAYKPRAV